MKKFLRKIFLKCCALYRNFAAKYPFLDIIALKLYYFPRLKRKIKLIKNIDKDSQYNLYNSNVETLINYFLDQNPKNRNIYIYMVIGGAGDPSYIFLFLKYLVYHWKCNNNNITIICDKKFIDIICLYKKYFDVSFIPIENPIVEPQSFDELPKFLKDIIIYNNGFFVDALKCNCDNLNTFIITNGKYGSMYKHVGLLGWKLFKGLNLLNDIKIIGAYNNYQNVDFGKIKDLLKSYGNHGKIILCNFESKTLSCGNFDGISFDNYLEKLNFLSEKYNCKFILNSVYNKEKLTSNKNIVITRLNFQEIIRLAEHDKIELFISERNGLNDVFYVFYPSIKQIIYYPSNYIYYVDCNYFDKKCGVPEGFNVKNSDFWRFPNSKNIIYQGFRKNFNTTIADFLNRVIS